MYAYRWNEYPTVAEGRSIDEHQSALDGRHYKQLGDSGWHMLLCWEAGPERVVRSADSLSAHRVRTTTTDPRTGETESTFGSRSEQDQRIIEFEVNSYLEDAGVPPRPPGFVWHLMVPNGRKLAGLVEKIFERETTYAVLRPPQTAESMRAALAEFYSER